MCFVEEEGSPRALDPPSLGDYLRVSWARVGLKEKDRAWPWRISLKFWTRGPDFDCSGERHIERARDQYWENGQHQGAWWGPSHSLRVFASLSWAMWTTITWKKPHEPFFSLLSAGVFPSTLWPFLLDFLAKKIPAHAQRFCSVPSLLLHMGTLLLNGLWRS